MKSYKQMPMSVSALSRSLPMHLPSYRRRSVVVPNAAWRWSSLPPAGICETSSRRSRPAWSRHVNSSSSVLCSPTCKIAITHAGAGTVLASLSAGVPLVLVPRGTPSQLRMAEACEKADVGRSCAGKAEIDAAVSDVLSNAAIASRVAVGANQIATMPTGASVALQVDDFVRDLR